MFSGKNTNLCILKCISVEKKFKINNVCLPYLKFSDLLPETHILFFSFGLMEICLENTNCQAKEESAYLSVR